MSLKVQAPLVQAANVSPFVNVFSLTAPEGRGFGFVFGFEKKEGKR